MRSECQLKPVEKLKNVFNKDSYGMIWWYYCTKLKFYGKTAHDKKSNEQWIIKKAKAVGITTSMFKPILRHSFFYFLVRHLRWIRGTLMYIFTDQTYNLFVFTDQTYNVFVFKDQTYNVFVFKDQTYNVFVLRTRHTMYLFLRTRHTMYLFLRTRHTMYLLSK